MASYNQSTNAQSVRVGNWFEELKLKEDTGVRYYPDPTQRSNSLLTQSRCIEHSDRLEPKNYTTVTRATIIDPRTVKKDRPYDTVGPRRKIMENNIKKMIDEEIERKTASDYTEARRLTYATATKDSFTKSGFTPTLKENDINVRLPTKNTNYSTETPVTLYSHAIADPRQKVAFPTTYVGSVNPFRKNCYFSNDIRSTVLNKRSETEERPIPLTNVLQFKTLELLVKRLFEAINKHLTAIGEDKGIGSAVRYLLNVFGTCEDLSIDLNDFENLLLKYIPTFDSGLSNDEKRALLATFDTFSKGFISLQELALFIKRTPSPRRLELMEFFYYHLDNHNLGFVNLVELKERLTAYSWNSNKPLQNFYAIIIARNGNNGNDPAGVEFTMNDFFDYYIDASTEIKDDEVFEGLLRETWSGVN